MNPFDWIGRWAALSPDKIAVREIEGSRDWTYRELNTTSCHLARMLSDEFGIARGDRVAILAENSIEHFLLFAAAQKAGFILVPLNHRLAAPEIQQRLVDCTAALVIVAGQFRSVVDSCDQPGLKVLNLEKLASRLAVVNSQPPPQIADPDLKSGDPLFIIYTSGTTGDPKGAIYTHRMLFWNSVNTMLRLALTGNDHTITCLPLFHTGGLNVLSTPLLHCGGSFTLLRKFDAKQVLQLLQDHKGTIFMAVPTLLKMMAEDIDLLDRLDFSHLRYFIVGGEALPIPLIEFWHGRGIPIRQGYGMTEVGPNLTSLHQDDAVRKAGSIGLPNFYVETRILTEDGREAADNEAGELLLRGPMATPGYWQNPEATDLAIRDGWFHTGDMVRRDEEGFLYIVDRKKNMYISGGENVYPAEVEKCLHRHPAVADAVVIGVPHERWGECGLAIIVRNAGEMPTAEEIITYCRDNLAHYKVPSRIVFVDELPKSDTGKIDRKLLQGQYQ